MRTEYYQTFADYLRKFLDAYKAQGIKFWGISTSNEPTNAWFSDLRINTMQWSPDSLSLWIEKNLGPTLMSNGYNDTKIWILDDQRYIVPWFLEDLKFVSKKAYDFISGVALHWYTDAYVPVNNLDKTHKRFPEKSLFMTESCTGFCE